MDADLEAQLAAINKHIGRMIALTRDQHGYSQQRVAEALGIKYQQVQKYESGFNRVSAASLSVIATIFEHPIEQFYPQTPQNDLSSPDTNGLQETPSLLQPPGPTDGKQAPAREIAELLRHFNQLEDRATRQSVIDIVKRLATK